MLMVMDMSTGKIIEEEFGTFEHEVLNAEWQPMPPLPATTQLGLQEAVSARGPEYGIRECDADAFLRQVYRVQE